MKIWKSLSTALLCSTVCASAWAAQQKPASAPQKTQKAEAAKPESAEEKVLHQRSDAYYAAILKGDNAAARQFVAAESQENFDHLDLKSLESTKFISANIDESGNGAVVRNARIYRAPIGIGMAFDDNWKKVDGQWFLTIPATDARALFGIPTSNQPAATPDQQELQKQIELQGKINGDPDQVYRRLREIQEQEKQRKAAEAAATQQQAATEQPAAAKPKKKSKKNADDAKSNSMTPPGSSPQQP